MILSIGCDCSLSVLLTENILDNISSDSSKLEFSSLEVLNATFPIGLSWFLLLGFLDLHTPSKWFYFPHTQHYFPQAGQEGFLPDVDAPCHNSDTYNFLRLRYSGRMNCCCLTSGQQVRLVILAISANSFCIFLIFCLFLFVFNVFALGLGHFH